LTTAIVPPDEELLGVSRNGSQVVPVAPELLPPLEELELPPPELDELEELEPPLPEEDELTPPEELELLLDELPELEELEPPLDELPEDEPPEDELLPPELDELELLLELELPLSSWWQALRRSTALKDRASGKMCDAIFIWGLLPTAVKQLLLKYQGVKARDFVSRPRKYIF
jgi:hypothetical protein